MAEELEVRRRLYSRVMERYRQKGARVPFFRTVARTALRLKIAMDHLRVRSHCRGKEEEIHAWFDRTHLFFGFAIYRSGTAFLATFLNQAVPDAMIEHEANVDDYWYYHLALQSDEEAERYLREFRLAEIYYRAHRRPVSVYGEINPYLRRHVRALKQVLPKATLFHLVRDGRSAVRSLMSRELLGHTDPLGHLTFPPPGDPYREAWTSMSRFEKICWLWQSDNRYLRENVGLTVQFEKLTGEYDAFKKFTDHIGVEVSQKVWQEYTHRVGNRTQVFRMSSWTKWSESDREVFRRICGEEMRACGYEFE